MTGGARVFVPLGPHGLDVYVYDTGTSDRVATTLDAAVADLKAIQSPRVEWEPLAVSRFRVWTLRGMVAMHQEPQAGQEQRVFKRLAYDIRAVPLVLP